MIPGIAASSAGNSIPVPRLTSSSDYTIAVGTGAAAAGNKPANVAVGDLLIALVSFQLAHTAGQTVTEGTSAWSVFGPDLVTDGTKRGSTTWALAVTAGNIGSLPASWTWTSSAGSQRFTIEIFRVTGADLASGVASAAAGESAISTFTAGNSGNAIPVFTVTDPALALVIAFGIAQNTLTQTIPPHSWAATGYDTNDPGAIANTTTGGVSWSAHYIGYKTADPDGTENSIQQIITPTPANAQTWAIAIKAFGGTGSGLGNVLLGTAPLGG